jgi:hypothetical protein
MTAAELHLQTIAALNQEIVRGRQQAQALQAEVQRLKEENKRLKDAAPAPSLPPEAPPKVTKFTPPEMTPEEQALHDDLQQKAKDLAVADRKASCSHA